MRSLTFTFVSNLSYEWKVGKVLGCGGLTDRWTRITDIKHPSSNTTGNSLLLSSKNHCREVNEIDFKMLVIRVKYAAMAW